MSIRLLALKIFQLSWQHAEFQGYPHSIWQIVLHMNYWMDYELQQDCRRRIRIALIRRSKAGPRIRNRQARRNGINAREEFVALLARLATLADSPSEEFARIVHDVGPQKTPRQSTVSRHAVADHGPQQLSRRPDRLAAAAGWRVAS